MSKPFVCTGCRVRLALRPRATAGLDIASQRRDFSGPSNSDRPATSSGHYGQIQEQRERVRRQRIYEDGLSQVGLGRGQPSAGGGRYSGQPLKPQHLLQELGESRPSVQARSQRDPRPSRQWNNNTKQPRSGPPLATTKFEDHVAKLELVEAWDTLCQLKARKVDGLVAMFRPSAIKKLHQLMRRITVDYTRHLGGSGKTGLPTPWEFVQVVKDLGLLSPPLRSELLWRVGNGLAMTFRFENALKYEDQARALQQIALLWQDTLETRLKPASLARTTTETELPLPWAFLPSAHSIVNAGNDPHKRLDDVLARIVPNGGSQKYTEAVGDYQSALFVALDLLKHNADWLNSGTSTIKASLYATPMVVFFDEILERVMKPDIPHAIRVRLEQSEDPALAYFEAMVRRFDFANVPPIRTDRSKALKDHRTPKIDELGRPVTAQYAATSIKKDMEAAGPEGSEDTSDSKPAPAAVTLDTASLREAGFTVNEDWDMDRDIHVKVLGWVKRLGRSIENSNLLITEACWDEVRQFNAKQSGASSLPLFLYEHFMLAFLALRQPRLALEAWTTVVESGLKPTVKTWTVMMRGCSRANDADALEKFWARMIEQNVQPDQHAWSVRLYSLVKAQRINKAFAALHQMGQEWISAVRAQQRASLLATKGKQHVNLPQIDLTQWTSDVNGVPRPSLVVVNAIVSSLASKSDEHIPQVLTWARDFAIELDLTTYNALLNVAMRHGNTAEAMSILQHMEKRSIQPNSTTTTVILAALFKSDYFIKLPTDEQITKLFSLIAAIEESSPTAKLDVKGYALAIDRMLKEHANPAAARALLEQMSMRGLEPTAHIYTILMTSYFEADPPDFAAAEALWNKLDRGNAGYGAALDTIFYDRMVEAYARHHLHAGVTPMMKFLERMSREGKRPGWPVLELVARALVDREEWGMLHSLVDDIQHSKGVLRVGARGLVGQNEFWRYIISTGILNRMGGKSEHDLRRNISSSSFHGLRDAL
jgi:pentatricopeptide repeat protein